MPLKKVIIFFFYKTHPLNKIFISKYPSTKKKKTQCVNFIHLPNEPDNMRFQKV